MISRRAIVTCCAAALTLAAASAGQATAASTHKVKFSLTGKLVETNTVRGKVSGTPWGRGTYVAKVDYPTATYTLKLKGGTIRFVERGKLDGTTARSTWRITRGTGKFKRITGSGKGGGDIRGNTFKYTGRVRY